MLITIHQGDEVSGYHALVFDADGVWVVQRALAVLEALRLRRLFFFGSRSLYLVVALCKFCIKR